MDILTIVKAKLPSNYQISDDLISVYIEEVSQAAETYMNRFDIPKELNFTIASMVFDLLNEQSKNNQDESRVVSSIKEGDTTIAYGSASKSTSQQITESIVLNHTEQLRRFRKMRR